MSELWLKEAFTITVFVSTDIPDKTVCVVKSREPTSFSMSLFFFSRGEDKRDPGE